MDHASSKSYTSTKYESLKTSAKNPYATMKVYKTPTDSLTARNNAMLNPNQSMTPGRYYSITTAYGNCQESTSQSRTCSAPSF